jgi:ribosomal protein S18 acetylase RimI-like enzyme
MKSHGTIELGDVTVHNVRQLRRLNQAIFPVVYNDKFYKDVLQLGELVKLVYFNDIVVGAVCSREERTEDGLVRLYIMTLGCLAPYRRHGIGRMMLEHLLTYCEQDTTIDNIYLHVQVSNADAIAFYEKFGFSIVERKENYYKRIEPTDAFVLQRNLRCCAVHTQTEGSLDAPLTTPHDPNITAPASRDNSSTSDAAKSSTAVAPSLPSASEPVKTSPAAGICHAHAVRSALASKSPPAE